MKKVFDIGGMHLSGGRVAVQLVLSAMSSVPPDCGTTEATRQWAGHPAW
jgi:hypothetical protein